MKKTIIAALLAAASTVVLAQQYPTPSWAPATSPADASLHGDRFHYVGSVVGSDFYVETAPDAHYGQPNQHADANVRQLFPDGRYWEMYTLFDCKARTFLVQDSNLYLAGNSGMNYSQRVIPSQAESHMTPVKPHSITELVTNYACRFWKSQAGINVDVACGNLGSIVSLAPSMRDEGKSLLEAKGEAFHDLENYGGIPPALYTIAAETINASYANHWGPNQSRETAESACKQHFGK